VAIISAFLDLEKNISFSDGLLEGQVSHVGMKVKRETSLKPDAAGTFNGHGKICP
jgi:hypothetical protein